MEEHPWVMNDEDRDELGKMAGMKNEDIQELEESLSNIQAFKGLVDPNQVNDIQRELTEHEFLEIGSVLVEISGAAYNCTEYLIYDLDFNVTNLILAAIQHNPQAPVIFTHWYPQLIIMDRYASVREAGFDWSWDDVQGADISELERYYAGLGYTEIPSKNPIDSGIITLEDLDEDEIKMASMERWITDVYNSEWDRKDFDDDDIKDEDVSFQIALKCRFIQTNE